MPGFRAFELHWPGGTACDGRLVRYLGIDLAWGEGSQAKPANRSGVVALERRTHR